MFRSLLAATASLLVLFAACVREDAAPPADPPLPESEIAEFVREETPLSSSGESGKSESSPSETGDESERSIAAYPGASDPVPIGNPAPQESQSSAAPEAPPRSAPPESKRAAAPPLAEAEPPGEPAAAMRRETSPAGVVRIEAELLRLINDERRQNGLEELGIEPDMQLAASIRAIEALEDLSHTRPDHTPYHTAFDETGFQYAGKWHGENLAIIHIGAAEYDDSIVAAALFAEWSKSPGHQQNFLGKNFVQTGVAVCIRPNGDSVDIGAAQLFASL